MANQKDLGSKTESGTSVGYTPLLDQLEEDVSITGQVVHNELDQMKADYFFLGLTSGASLQMFIVAFVLMYICSDVAVGPLNELSREYYPVFRMILYVLWFFTLYGCVLFIWKRYKIDYWSILDLPRSHTYQYVIRGSASSAYVVFTCFLLYVLTISGLLDHISSISKHAFPILALLIPTAMFLWPKDMHTSACFGVDSRGFSQRWNLLRQLFAIIHSPFSKTTRIRSLIADILCSMPKCFGDMVYTIFLYANFRRSNERQTVDVSSSFYIYLTLYCTLLPYGIRFMQSVRQCWDEPAKSSDQYFNLVKYALSISVSLLNIAQKNAMRDGSDSDAALFWQNAWKLVAAFTTAMSYYSDVVHGWGLGNRQSKNWLLRDDLTFPMWSYYAAMIINFLFRLCWAINISPGQPYVAQNFVLLIGCIELLRRNMWLAFRIESLDVTRKTTIAVSSKAAPMAAEMPLVQLNGKNPV